MAYFVQVILKQQYSSFSMHVCPYIEYGPFPSNIYDLCDEYFVESPRQRNQEFSCCTDARLHVGVL